jgi:hypothetical protein
MPPDVLKAKQLFKEIEAKCSVRTIDDDEKESDDEKLGNEKGVKKSDAGGEEEDKEVPVDFGDWEGDEGDEDDEDDEGLTDFGAESGSTSAVEAVDETAALRRRRESVSSQGKEKGKRKADGKSFLIKYIIIIGQQVC